jgi:S-adenosylmethionine synthetase
VERQAELRKSGELPWLRPDAKSQVTLRYEGGKPVAIDAVVLSTQHDAEISQPAIHEAVRELIIKPVLPEEWLHRDTRYHINPTGQFIIGGPVGDCGLTGRKIIVDTYGGMAATAAAPSRARTRPRSIAPPPTRPLRGQEHRRRRPRGTLRNPGVLRHRRRRADVDRRQHLRHRARIDDEQIVALVHEHFDLRPKGLIDMLDLKRPIYRSDRRYGHFGREAKNFTWERTDKADALRSCRPRRLPISLTERTGP